MAIDATYPRLPGLTLLAMPPYETALANQSFEAAVTDTHESGTFPNGWTLEGGVTTGARAAGAGYRGDKAYKLYPTAGTATTHSLLYRYGAPAFLTLFPHLEAVGGFYATIMARLQQGGAMKIRLQADFIAAGPSTLQTFTTDFNNALAADNAWRMVRGDLWQPSAATLAALSYVEVRFLITPYGFANWQKPPPILFLDYAHFGLLLDGADLAAGRTEAMKEDVYTPRVEDFADDGPHEAVQFNAGFHRGNVSLGGFDEAGANCWRRWHRRASSFLDFSVQEEFGNFDRGWFPKCFQPPCKDGLTPLPGLPTYQGKLPWEARP